MSISVIDDLEPQSLFPDSVLGPTRVCRDCRYERLVSHFKNPEFSPGYDYPVCNTCRKRHDRYVRSLDYDALARRQGYERCAICKRPPNGYHLHIDTEVVRDADGHGVGYRARGLLCMNCNTGIGKFMHLPGVILQAVLYLLRDGSFKKRRA